MSRSLVLLALLMLVATPVFAYVQPGSLRNNTNLSVTKLEDNHISVEQPVSKPLGDAVDAYPRRKPLADDEPTRPVPEPGTLALATMSLLAAGAAARKKMQR